MTGKGGGELALQRRGVPLIRIDIWALKWILVNIPTTAAALEAG